MFRSNTHIIIIASPAVYDLIIPLLAIFNYFFLQYRCSDVNEKFIADDIQYCNKICTEVANTPL